MNRALIQSQQLSPPKAKVKKSASYNIVNSIACQTSVALNINFNSEREFKIIKISRNCKFQEVWTKLRISQSSENSVENFLDKFLNLREKNLVVKSFEVDFLHYLAGCQNL